MARAAKGEAVERSGHPAKRAAILNAAKQLFLDVGFSAASMDALAAKAGVSKATIYAHFENKEALLSAVITARCESEIKGPCLFESLSATDPAAGLTVIGRQFLGLMLEPDTIALYRMLIAEAPRQPEMVKAYYMAGPFAAKQALSAYLRSLTERGLLAIDDCWKAADGFFALLRGEYYMLALMGLPQPDDSPEAVVERAVQMMLCRFGVK